MWKTSKLVEISKIGDGAHASLKRVGSGIPYLTAKNITKAGIDYSNMDYISEETYNKHFKNESNALTQPQKDDILYSIIGSLGGVYVVQDEKIGISSSVAIFRADSDIVLPKYLAYFLKSTSFDLQVQAIKGGVAQGFMSLGKLGSINISYPEDIEYQEKIVKILSAYDDLIENNQKQIKLLEEAAQRLYKEWFVDLRFPGYENTKIVDGMPEGWTRPSMNDIAEYLNGYAFKPEDWSEKGKPIIKIKEMNEGITIATPRNDGSTIPEKYNITAGDILFSWSATLTAMIWASEDGLLNQHLFKVIPNNGVCREYVLQSILKTLDEFKNLTTGSTMKHIQRGKLKEVFINLPSQEVMEKFSSIVEVYREKILSLQKQNIFLQEARDRLLPKLMSGELEV